MVVHFHLSFYMFPFMAAAFRVAVALCTVVLLQNALCTCYLVLQGTYNEIS